MQFKFAMPLLAAGTALLVGVSAYAGPAEIGHPNIIAAHDAALMAIDKLKAAQAANEYDMNGHAAKAEQLLRQAEHEMNMAARAANQNR